MALIDLSRQARAGTVGGRVLRTTSTISSATGLYDVAWEVIAISDLGTGSIDIGSESDYVGKNLYLYDAVETTGGGNIYSTGSYGSNLVLQINPLGHPTGSVKIWGDLIVEGTSSVFNQATISIEDPIIDLNFTGSTALGSTDSGIRVGRSGGTNAQLVFDHSETRWAIDNAAGSNINIVGSSTTDTLTNKTITSLASSTMGSNADLTFSGGGEVLGLPATASVDNASTSKIYVQHRLDYLRKSYIKKASSFVTAATVGGVVGFATASFTAVTASAPTGITATSEDDFVFFINGQYMEHDALEIEQAGAAFYLKVDVDSIGYVLESDDEIIAHGKFNA
jgi:hypothetical protein